MITEFGRNLLPTSDHESRSWVVIDNHLRPMFIKWPKSKLSNQIINPENYFLGIKDSKKQSKTNKQEYPRINYRGPQAWLRL